ncbi:hypothetical protein KXX11_003298, partial [Aspergillus fumigatus]
KGTAFPVVLTPGVGSGWDNLSNKGDVPAWPVIRVEGPLESWSVQIDGLRVSSDYPVEEFDWITIDTDPRKQSALLNGFEDVMDRLKEWEFAPIPPGGSKSVNIEMVGLGAIVVSITLFTPDYRRVAPINFFESLKLSLKWNGLSTLELVVSGDHSRLDGLTKPGARLVVDYGGGQIFSGPVRKVHGVGPWRSSRVTITCEDDIRLLWRMLMWPVNYRPGMV